MKKIICIVGPSGSGKTTIANRLKEHGVPELVSHTTRNQRTGERSGISYHFVSKDAFHEIDKVEESEYAGNLYGLSRLEVDAKLSQNDSVILVTDIHGMQQVKRIYPDITTSVFLQVTMREMEERMIGRGDTCENVGKRLENAETNKELENWRFCDHVVRNEILDMAVNLVLNLTRKS